MYHWDMIREETLGIYEDNILSFQIDFCLQIFWEAQSLQRDTCMYLETRNSIVARAGISTILPWPSHYRNLSNKN